MDPIEIIAWLSAELAATKAENQRLRAALGESTAGLEPPTGAIGHPAGTYPRRARSSDLSGVDDPLAPDAEARHTALSLADRFLQQSKQVREIIRVLVAAYPNYCRAESFDGHLHSTRASDGSVTRVQLGVQLTKIRKVFGEEAVENRRGDGWRAGKSLLMIFDKPRDLEAEADVDLAR